MFFIVGQPSTKCFILLAHHRPNVLYCWPTIHQMFYIVGPRSATVAQQYKIFGRRWANNLKHYVDVSCRRHWQWRTGMVDGVAWLAAVSLTGCVRRSAWQTGRRSSRQDEIFSLDIPATSPLIHIQPGPLSRSVAACKGTTDNFAGHAATSCGVL